MNDNQLIPLFKIIDNKREVETLFSEYVMFFDEYEEFVNFLKMQLKFYPRGILRKELVENIANYSVNATMNKLRQKLGSDAISEHVTEGGTTFYSMGKVDKGLLEDE
jgi:hypothetical protein